MKKQLISGTAVTDDKILKAQKELFEQHNPVIASERDREIFFDVLTNLYIPNQKLLNAAKRYRTFIAENK
jgi:uncharacterized protein (DUF1778 family)